MPHEEVSQTQTVQSQTVYVPVVVEGDTLWRPTPALALRPDVFRLETPDDYDPDFEAWQFAPGDAVRCELTTLEDGEYLVAVEKLSPNN